MDFQSILCMYTDLTIKLTQYVHIINECTLVIGLLGNITACTVIMFSRAFRTLTGFYLLSLSAADILILTTSVTYDACLDKYNLLYGTKEMTYIGEFLFQTSVVASTLTVTAFTVERYLAICHPFFVQSLPKKSRVRKIIISIWLISGLVALLPVVNLILELRGVELQEAIQDVMQYVMDVWAVLYFFMPMSIITVLYILIWFKLKKRTDGIDCRADRADTRTMTMFVIIIATFFISWSPHYICRVLLGHLILENRREFTSGEDVVGYMNKMYRLGLGKQATYSLSAALNPLIYTIVSKKFREAFKDLVTNSSQKLFDRSFRSAGNRNSSNKQTVETIS